MNDWIAATCVGIVLFVIGLIFMYSHVSAWRRQQEDDSIEESERKHYRSRFHRRMQTSGLIALLGVMIPVGDVAIPWQNMPKPEAALWGSIYWGVVLLLTVWVLLLAMGDLYATKTHAQATLARNYDQQRVLERKIAEIKRRQSNGHHSSH